jgi:hypothetical protein
LSGKWQHYCGSLPTRLIQFWSCLNMTDPTPFFFWKRAVTSSPTSLLTQLLVMWSPKFHQIPAITPSLCTIHSLHVIQPVTPENQSRQQLYFISFLLNHSTLHINKLSEFLTCHSHLTDPLTLILSYRFYIYIYIYIFYILYILHTILTWLAIIHLYLLFCA